MENKEFKISLTTYTISRNYIRLVVAYYKVKTIQHFINATGLDLYNRTIEYFDYNFGENLNDHIEYEIKEINGK
jgi:hypothetical protein